MAFIRAQADLGALGVGKELIGQRISREGVHVEDNRPTRGIKALVDEIGQGSAVWLEQVRDQLVSLVAALT